MYSILFACNRSVSVTNSVLAVPTWTLPLFSLQNLSDAIACSVYVLRRVTKADAASPRLNRSAVTDFVTCPPPLPALRQVNEGMLLLGIVKEVREADALVSLPNNLTGWVEVDEVKCAFRS